MSATTFDTEVDEAIAKTILPLILNQAHADVASLVRRLTVELEKTQRLTAAQRLAMSETVADFVFHYADYSALCAGRFKLGATPPTTPIVAPFPREPPAAPARLARLGRASSHNPESSDDEAPDGEAEAVAGPSSAAAPVAACSARPAGKSCSGIPIAGSTTCKKCTPKAARGSK